MQHAVTIDLEDWHQLVYRRVGRAVAPTTNVITDTRRALDLLDEAGTRATFFVVGDVADTHPDLVREVAARGHEIGSHTYRHQLITSQTAEEFRADVDRSRKQLQDLTGQPVLGFRAPEFSVSHLGHWSFDVLAEAGFAYDSSVVPVGGVRYGIPDASTSPFVVATHSGRIWEFPLPAWNLHGKLRPVGGGSYFRILPRRVLRDALRGFEGEGRPAVLYFHPYEFHRGWLYLEDLTLRERLQRSQLHFSLLHNFRTGAVGRLLRDLLNRFSFAPLGQLYQQLSQPSSAFRTS